MARATSQHEEVPDRVHVAMPIQREKDYARRVRQAAREQPENRARCDVGQQRADGDDHEPAHSHVDSRREHGEPAGAKDALECDAGGGQAPDDAEQRPSPGAAHAHEDERSVCAGDEEVDRGVVQAAEDFFRAPEDVPGKGVVERRGGIQ